MEYIVNESDESCLSSPCSDVNDPFGDPEILPRVGDDYQAIIPPIMAKYHHLPSEALSSSVPIMWIHDQFVDMKNSDFKLGGLHPVPGIASKDWEPTESASFILGLYIFGKNLGVVKRFIETKLMGDILAHYYGRFYRSSEYRRWLECRKMRSRRCVHGQKIFTGWRRQELLSRLISHDGSEERRDVLMEVSKKFGEGKLTLAEYVFALKDIVGINLLIEAVAIGKEKQDLTGISAEPPKTNNNLFKLPAGKPFSSLDSGEIVKFLTGDFRLSKARSNDLFWEAVWPRLLARGWHSEQPKESHSLVFLVPGVKKFSRKRLTRENHYFDSVSDVLRKVASDPQLLEIDIDSPPNGEFENKDRKSYLRPKSSGFSQDSVEFMVVDTSLASGEGGAKIRELKSLPVDRESKEIGLYRSLDEYKKSVIENGDHDEYLKRVAVLPGDPKLVTGNANPEPVIENGNHDECKKRVSISPSVPKLVTDIGNAKPVIENGGRDKYPKRVVVLPSVAVTGNENSDAVIENRDHDECRKRVSILPSDPKLVTDIGNPKPVIENGDHDEYPKRVSILPSDPKLVMENGSRDGSRISVTRQPATVLKYHFSRKWKFQPPPIAKNQEFTSCNEESKCMPDMAAGQVKDDLDLSEERIQQPELPVSNTGSLPETVNGRRQSTRNRPPTAKALEAFAYGYLETKKRKGMEPSSSRMSRCSKRATGKTAIPM